MKILHVYHIYPALFGGVSRVVYDITKELEKRGHEISVLTTDAYFNGEQNCANGNIRVYRFSTLSQWLVERNIIVPNMEFVSWVKNNLREYDCIHLHGDRSGEKTIVYLYAKNFHIPFIFQSHGSLLRIMTKQKLKLIYDVFFGYKLLRDAFRVVALSRVEAEQYRSMGVSEEQIRIIPNGIDLSAYGSLPPKGSFKKKFGISRNKKIILYLGRIHKTKGIDLLIRAYAYLNKEMKCYDALLVIVGPDDGYLHEAESLADSLGVSASILFTGFISREDKLRALVDAEVFVTPSFYGFPMTFLEACATGTPIVTTNLGDSLEWIDGNVGLVTHPSYYELAKAIYMLIYDDELCASFSKNCINTVKSRFSLEKIVTELEKVYQDIIDNELV